MKDPLKPRKRRKGGGRHKIDDDANGAEIARLIETEKISDWDAAQKVAKVVKQSVDAATGKTPATDVENIAKRLHEKFKENPDVYYEMLYADDPEKLATFQVRKALQAMDEFLERYGIVNFIAAIRRVPGNKGD